MKMRIFVPRDAGAIAVGADDLVAALQQAAEKRGLSIEIIRNGSRGLYWLEPMVEVATVKGRVAYGPVRPADVPSLLDAMASNGPHALRLGLTDEIPWLKRQTRLTFARCGVINPRSVKDYLDHAGYKGLERALTLGSDDILAEVTASGLRGRGGAGFPTGIKWKTVAQASADRKYIVCNADEGDSGTFADRMIMEGDPFVVIEGMTIAGIAVGATKGYIYIRSEYPHAVAAMNAAITAARRTGYLGDRIVDSNHAFDLEVRVGAGAYVCGEETSLLESLEGRRGIVRAKPPLPAHKGLFGRPTVINNVLSFAAIPFILAGGAKAYADYGMDRSRGTMPIQLAGNVRHGGLFETAFGVTLGELIDDIGGGTFTGRPVRAVQVGGPLGAYFPRALFDTPFDYEAFAARDGLIGHGGIVVFDDSVDMAKQARFAMEFCAVESCGKCTPCRIGSTRGVETIDKIINGERVAENLAVVEDLCNTMKFGSLCALGGFTPYPVMSALKHFREDFDPAPAPPAGRGIEEIAMSLIQEIDFGTPRSKSEAMVTLTIDGQSITVPEGTSIMRAAMEAGTQIPKLCATDMVDAFGSCRLCLIEIEGRAGTPASCTTPAMNGLVVHTQTERLKKLRKGVMELYISDHPLDCLTCAANGDCELQDMAGAVGLRDVRYGYEGENHVFARADGCTNDNWMPKDESNPYFTYDPSKCIVCSRCVRACEEVQGTFALTISGRGFDSRVSPGMGESFLGSECVSCGACVQACPTATLTEKSVIDIGQPEHSVVTTCAYCGVGCAFKAEMRGEEVVRMVPYKDGKANRGHSCVKGRFAWGYTTHKERILKPMIRERIEDPWREVSWDEAFGFAAAKFKGIQQKYGRDAIGGITSSRCTNEETFLVQKLIRGGFGNNNVDTCARVCHSPTGYGLSQTFGTSAGTQDFDSVEYTDVVVVIGANPASAHPVFASRLKKRLRQGARLIVIDPRRTEMVEAPHLKALHLPLMPGTNVAVLTALAHVIVTEGLVNEAFVRERCDWSEFEEWATFVALPKNSPESTAIMTGVDPKVLREAARQFATGGNGAIYYGLGVTEHSQGSTTVIAIANLAMATGNIGRPGVGVNPLRGQNNVQGSCDMGSFPHELPGYRHISGDAVRDQFEAMWNVKLNPEPGLRIPNMFDAAIEGTFMGLYVQGEDILQSDPNTSHVVAALSSMECVIVHDLFLNETANYAHVFLPGSTFLEKDGTFTNAERRIQRVRKVMAPRNGFADWEVTTGLARAMGFDMHYNHPSEIMDEIAALTPTFAGVSYARLEELGSVQWPCNEKAPEGTPVMHIGGFVRGKGKFIVTEYIATDERTGPRFPLLLTTGRILSQYNVGAQTRRTENVVWHSEDLLEIHPHDAEQRGIRDGDWVRLKSRAGETTLRADITDRVAPGVVYTTFHHPDTQANVITTDYSDWATNCPEYKVTAVQISPSNGPSDWQKAYDEQARHSRRIAPAEAAE